MDTFRADERWYDGAFGPLTAAFWAALVPDPRIEEEAAFLAQALRPPTGGLLLDVPCGAARHAAALARRGFQVEGLDLSLAMLAEAQKQATPGVSVRRADMTQLDARERYDGAYCWGNSFGYLAHDESRRFLVRVVAAVKPGGRFVLESGAVAENLLPAFAPRTELDQAGFRFTAERRYEAAEGAMHIRYRIERAGEVEQFVAHQAVYTVGEILRMTTEAGLLAESLYGGLAGEPAGIGKPLVAVFRRL
jgi:SAM-dependent methyltransferase